MTIVALHDSSLEPSDAGFTLVEVLVGVVLLSLLTSVIFASLRFGVLAWGHGTIHADRLDRILSTHSYLRRLIGDAYPYYQTTDPTHGRVVFDGARDKIDFLAPPPASFPAGGRMRYTLNSETRGATHSLNLLSQAELAATGRAGNATRTSLLDEAEMIEFAYFGRRGSDRKSAWNDSWSGETSLPDLIRIRIQMGKRNWPDIIIAPRIDVDVDCVYDTLTKLCRAR